jgi:hypothetical protein
MAQRALSGFRLGDGRLGRMNSADGGGVGLDGANPSEELIKIETRPDVTLKFLVIRPSQPAATVVLFTCGRGDLELASGAGTPTLGRADYFLARTREGFARHGSMVALVDVPSDRQAGGIDSRFRISNEHAEDIREVISAIAGFIRAH